MIKFKDRDAFDTLFDHAPEKLSLVKNVINNLFLDFLNELIKLKRENIFSSRF